MLRQRSPIPSLPVLLLAVVGLLPAAGVSAGDDPCPTAAAAACDIVVTGELAPATDCPLVVNGNQDGTVIDVFELELAASQEVTLQLESDAFDAFLYFQDPGGEELAADDDGGQGTDALVAATAPGSGTYRVLANAFFRGTGGAYTLTVTCTTVAPEFIFADGFEPGFDGR